MASSPQRIEHKYTLMASSPQLKEQKFTEHQAFNFWINLDLLGVFSSYLKSQKSFSHQTKATGKLTQLSTTFMFTPKANSKQKRVKKTQTHETGRAVREQLGKNSLFTPKISILTSLCPNLIQKLV
ncbi:hypothetical protein MTR_3g034675 [Medicago truncatula]|uniref:Uncharacterized protein n=1 Tax=Medicago truncatula TaxID=3880 RepID=A0A072UUF9_MEDTR|nr:hypothetical protein MTR_3g034675 [Medicago truncatula]